MPDERLVRLFQEELDSATNWILAQKNFELHQSTYPEVVADPQGAAREIRNFLGRDLDVERLTSSVDRNLHRVRHRRWPG